MSQEKVKSVLTCDIQAARYISPADLAREAELAKTCWWDYRGIHPVRRTEFFATQYRAIYQRYYAKYYDYSKKDVVSGLAGKEDIFNFSGLTESRARAKKTNLTGLWRARQAADELGIRYEIYISAIFEKACMNGKVQIRNGRPQFPRPTHLYSDKAKLAALDEMVDELERYVPDFRNGHLKVGSQAPWKDEFDGWLYNFVALKRVNKDITLDRLVELNYITRETADDWLQRFRGG